MVTTHPWRPKHPLILGVNQAEPSGEFWNLALMALHAGAHMLADPITAEPNAVASLLARIAHNTSLGFGSLGAGIVLEDDPAWSNIAAGGDHGPSWLSFTTHRSDGQLFRRRRRSRGVISHVVATAEPVYVVDTLGPSPYGPFPARIRHGVRAFASAPVVSGQRVLGVLTVTFIEPTVLGQQEQLLLEVFASQAAASLERVRAAHAERRRADQADRLAAILAEVGAASDLSKALTSLVRGAMTLLGGARGGARVFDPQSGAPLIKISIERSGTVQVRVSPETPLPGSYTAAIHQGGPPVIVDDFLALDPAIYPMYQRMKRRGMRSSIHVPLEVSGKRIGSLSLDHEQPNFFGPADVAVALALTTQAGGAIERARRVGAVAPLRGRSRHAAS